MLVDKPYLLAYMTFATFSRLLSAEAWAMTLPYYTALAVAVTVAWYFAVPRAAKRRLGIVGMFKVPDVKIKAFREQLLPLQICAQSPPRCSGSKAWLSGSSATSRILFVAPDGGFAPNDVSRRGR